MEMVTKIILSERVKLLYMKTNYTHNVLSIKNINIISSNIEMK